MRCFLITAVPIILAMLCALAIVPWLLGVPGTDNNYAKGWTIGFYALLAYLTVFIILAILRVAAHLGWFRFPAHTADSLSWSAVLGFAIARGLARWLILGGN
ncbi:hypothetical protein N8D56_04000 [Devosia sp. A8/3-2]|nr:hypothetical protein N8D56_04000 [Devosia sp. A8/3-2]